ncbi:MAG: ribonuclease HI [Clostridia bacterium]|jgi:ribonuclease HI|nr:ribonuclease HI [Clostridia bacterium]
MEEITIYTDGACSGNPGPGGWGSILIYKNVEKEISGSLKNTTNNIMELTAVVEALKLLKFKCKVKIYSDSAYVVNAFNQKWIYSWIKNNWINSNKEPVKNKEIWKELYELTQKHEVEFIKVKGHSDNEYNNRCDEIARKEIYKHTNK